MSKPLPEPEKHYVWKVLFVDEDLNERLVTPNSDPMEYEVPMDLLFDTIELAHQGLIDYGLVEQAIEEEWVLCINEVTPVSLVVETLIPKE